MDEKLNEALATMINKLVAGADVAVGFLGEQLPSVIQELLLWRLAMHSVDMLIGLILLGMPLAALMWWRCYVKPGEFEDERCMNRRPTWSHNYNGSLSDTGALAAVVLCSVSVLGVSMSFVQMNLKWLQILLAPKVYLLEYAASLVK